MSKFKDAVERGLSLARSAKDNNDQIDGVFDELNSEIKSMTDGKVGIFLSSPSRSDMIEGGMVDLDSDFTAEGLFLYNEYGNHQIGLVVKSEAGYPCTIKFRDTNYHSFDKKSLEENINMIMESSFIGRIILSLYEQPF